MLYREITRCRACGSDRLELALDLGNLCISDFPKPGEPEPERAPLTLVQCQDCTLVQLRHTVERDRLYRHYYYRSGTQESMIRSLKDVVDEAQRAVRLQDGDLVLDVGANDGTLLRQYPERLIRVGFEPSDVLPPDLDAEDPIIFKAFFPPEGVRSHWLPTRPKVITSIAMFYDVDDPNAFVAAVKEWLHSDGVWIVQLQDLHAMVAANAIDNVCHEHLTYWSLRPLRLLLERHGLRIDGASYNPTNGGSLRVIVRHGPVREPEPVDKHIAFVERQRLLAFAERVEEQKTETLAFLMGCQTLGYKVLGYGASTKGNTLLQYYGIGTDLLPAIADRNPDKVGRTTVTGIPIISEEELRARGPMYLFALPWHFVDSFRARELDFELRGGQWVVSLPRFRVIKGVAPCQRSTVATCASG